MNTRTPHAFDVRARHPGFTLIELLTVIAIIGILAAIIVPVVGKVRATATKATCASNLRQLATASLLFAQDNKQQLPTRDTYGHRDSWRHLHVYHQHDFMLFRGYLGIPEANREATPLLFCAGPLKESISSASPNYNGDAGLFVSYSYYNLKNLNASVFTDYGTDEKKTRRADQIPPRFPLWGCLTINVGGSTYIGHNEPRTNGGFSGQNVARADGSVRWHKSDELIPFVTEAANTYYGPRP